MSHLPVRPIKKPSILDGHRNGRLPSEILVSTPGIGGTPPVRLVAPAARAWRAMAFNADIAGHKLAIGWANSAYRPYEDQERLFRQRFTTSYLPGRPGRIWRGQRWYLKPGVALAAVPGTSNHGFGLALDLGEWTETGVHSIDAGTVNWLIANAHRYGFSAEVQSEPWHWVYWAGDDVPLAVVRHEAPPIEEPEPDKDSDMDIINDPEAERMWAQWINGGTTIVREYSNYRGKDVGKVLPGIAYVIDEQVKAGKIRKA